MKNYTHKFDIKTSGNNDIINISDQVIAFIRKQPASNGIVLVHSPGSTCGITTIEYEPGVVQDLKNFFEKIAPSNQEYAHNQAWGDGNGFSHIRAAFIKSNFSFPIIDGEAILGTWQQIVLIDFDNRGRNREIFVQILAG